MEDSGIRPTPGFDRGHRIDAPGGPLTDAWVLIVGPDATAAARLRGRLAVAGCAAVEIVEDVEEAMDRVEIARPDAILAVGQGEDVRRRMDPIGLENGPPVVAMEDVSKWATGAAGEEAILDRLAFTIERAALRRRVTEMETLLASQTIGGHRELEAIRLDGLRRLAIAAEYRDDNTWEHTQRVAMMAARLARGLGLPDRTIEHIRLAAPLHDIGKIAIPDYILLKPEKLTDEEYEVVKTHAAVGARILAEGDSEIMQVAEQIAAAHHERWDGRGYPAGLAAADIPVAGRLVAVADVFDILIHERPYKEEWTVEDAAKEIERNSGSQFDPEVVEAFIDLGSVTWQALAAEF